MSQVDILRFVANVQQLFAPSIHEGQTFIAYLDEEDNSYLIQGDNLSFEGSGTLGGEVEKLQQNLDALQTVVNALQPIVDELSGSNAINIVDDIVFGYCDSSFNPENLADLKGRPFLYFDGYSFCLMIDNRLASGGDSQIQLSQEITAGSVFAGFGDGKIHTINDVYRDSGITSKTLSNGDFILNKADNCLYIYDADNHAFVRIGGKQHYAVDYIVDYVGYGLPSTFTVNEAVFFKLNQDYAGGSITPFCSHESGDSFSFANIQGILSGEAEIYSVDYYGNSNQIIRATHDLYNGDIVFCKADNCSYTFFNSNGIKSFVKSSDAFIIVEDIIYGYYDSSADSPLTPSTIAELRGRLFLDSHYFDLEVTNSLSSGTITGVSCSKAKPNSIYAGFGDGKFHTVVEDNYNELRYSGCKDIQHGQLILCNADSEFYTYDANNHKFIRAGNGRHYVVDMIIDYVGESLPATFTNEGTLFLDISHALTLSYMAKKYSDQLTSMGYVAPDIGFRFANIQSILSDDAGIYSVEGEFDKCIRVIHDLQDGDTIFCKADGCTYTFSDNGTTKSFIRTSTPAIAPVLDIVSITGDSPDSPSATDDKYIYYNPNYSGNNARIYTAVTKHDWDNGRQIQSGERYASLNNHRIYEFQSGNKPTFPVAIPVGVPFLNKADNEMYVFDGLQFVKACGTQQNNYAPVIAPVLDVVPITDDSPYSPSAAGDKYIYYDPSGSGAYGYFYTAPNNYEWGSPRDIQQGERYASTIDFKLYEFQGNYEEAIISDIPIGVPFLNKSDSCLYVYDGSDFVKIGGN